MRAVDTNILVRLVTGDDTDQTLAAEGFVAEGAWVSTLALVETIRVLKRRYRMNAVQQADTIDELLSNPGLVHQDPQTAAAALTLFRAKPTLGFSDCLMLELARKAGHLPLGTFDRTLGRVKGAQKL